MKHIFRRMVPISLAAIVTLTSCSKDSILTHKETETRDNILTHEVIETRIVGLWKTATENEEPILTRDRAIISYDADKTGSVFMSRFLGFYNPGYPARISFEWKVEGHTLCENYLSGVTQFNKAVEIDDHHYSYVYERNIDAQGVQHMVNSNIVAQKVDADYSQDIIGFWESVAMNGFETGGDTPHRIRINEDYSYAYYTLVDGKWTEVEDTLYEWRVVGDWLTTFGQKVGSNDRAYEWWDIDSVDNGRMSWSSLRENDKGQRCSVTVIWAKIAE